MIHSWENHIDKRTAWSLIRFLIYTYLNILAQSQILVISLYIYQGCISFPLICLASPKIYCDYAPAYEAETSTESII